MIYSLGERRLTAVGDDYFVAPTAAVIGSVSLKKGASVWFGATLRGDHDLIEIGENTNIQDGTVIHSDKNSPAIIGDRVTIGHMVLLHSCHVGSDTLIGNGAIVLDRAKIGRNVIIAANTLIPPDKEIPDGVLVMGSPGKIMREVTAKDLALIEMSWHHYVENAARFKRDLKAEG
jgi:carbonic anhydrase/acetyltransferase-like protein (isoleucine patch superfamily)